MFVKTTESGVGCARESEMTQYITHYKKAPVEPEPFLTSAESRVIADYWFLAGRE
jgi:hypothetical protein